MGIMIKCFRLPFVFLAMLCLLLGLWSGLSRIGWDLTFISIAAHHGAIMVGGFLGTLISLEKIIPLKKKALFAIPVISASSVLFFILNQPLASFFALVLAALGLCGVLLFYLLQEKNLSYLLMLGGAFCWLTGNILLITKKFYPLSFPWWLAFTLLVITSERLELMKFLPVKRASKNALLIFLGVYLAAILLSFHGTGHRLAGAALIATSIWLMRHDVVGITIRKETLPRFTAVALLAGYVSLLLTGVFLLALNDQSLAYDAIVHTYFLGFVFSMIFAHGPIILPGVLGIAFKPYHKMLYAWLMLLHLSWIIRVAGDIILDLEMRRISGLISAFAILCYFATIATLTISYSRRHAKIL